MEYSVQTDDYPTSQEKEIKIQNELRRMQTKSQDRSMLRVKRAEIRGHSGKATCPSHVLIPPFPS